MSGRHVGRRSAAAGGVAMLVLAAMAAGSAKAAERDGELLYSAAEYHRLVAQDKAVWDSLKDAETGVGQAYWNEAEAEGGIWDRTKEAAARVMALRATTPKGIRAKAGVLQQMLLEHHDQELDEGRAGEEIAVAMSLVRDLLGRASA